MPSQSSDSADLGELFHAAFRGLRRTWAEQLAPWELTPHQWRALMTLMRRPDGTHCATEDSAKTSATAVGHAGVAEVSGASAEGVRLKDLAERLRIAPRSATEVVDQLESKGLVRRTPDPTDRRATLVTATETGEELFTNVSATRRDKSNEYFARLPDADRAELARILGQLRN